MNCDDGLSIRSTIAARSSSRISPFGSENHTEIETMLRFTNYDGWAAAQWGSWRYLDEWSWASRRLHWPPCQGMLYRWLGELKPCRP